MALGDVKISLDNQTVTVDEVKKSPSLSLLCDVDLNECVSVYKCVTSEQSRLIHLGDFVEYKDSNSHLVSNNKNAV